MDIRQTWETERKALHQLLSIIKVTPYNWGDDTLDYEFWQGIKTDETGRITKIFLPAMKIDCSLEDILEAIKGLMWLEVLDIHSNLIHGSLTSTINEFRSLKKLDVSMNSLQGTIPFMDLEDLERLDISMNHFEGGLESIKCKNLYRFQCRYNQLSGHIPAIVTPKNADKRTINSSYLDYMSDIYTLNCTGNQFTSIDASLQVMHESCFTNNILN